ncbi:MAG: RNA polymerase sigma-70 factor (family 1) [Neolewinella sp.]|jgi:RNA polymerase sigma-70 factor (ECF subfamily)
MGKMALVTDQDLFIQLRAGESTALDELFRRYYVDLCRTAVRFVNDEQEAEDIVQNLFVSLWEKRAGDMDELGAVAPYLRRAVRNRSLNYLRDRKRIPVDDTEVPETLAAKELADDELTQDELRDRIHKAIDTLPERCRLVFVMNKLEEMSHKEIAEALEISPKTVENQMTRAYRFLRKWLSLMLLTYGAFC